MTRVSRRSAGCSSATPTRPSYFSRACRTGLLALLLASPGGGVALAQSPGFALRFYGHGTNDIDRLKIRVDDPSNLMDEPGPPVDVGETDFTIEVWMKAAATDNAARAIACGAGHFSWISGNIILDRDRFSAGGRDFGMSLVNGGRIALGVENADGQAHTLCGSTNVLDDSWHHVAVQRRASDGSLWIFVDGRLDGQASGPAGDVSYPGNVYPDANCGGPCVNSDPFLVIGAEKHDIDRVAYPSFSGLLDELRISRSLRYGATFVRPDSPYVPDASTVGLYHFDEGPGAALAIDSGAAVGGPSNAVIRYGGNPTGPVWSADTPFGSRAPAPPTNVRFVR